MKKYLVFLFLIASYACSAGIEAEAGRVTKVDPEQALDEDAQGLGEFSCAPETTRCTEDTGIGTVFGLDCYDVDATPTGYIPLSKARLLGGGPSSTDGAVVCRSNEAPLDSRVVVSLGTSNPVDVQLLRVTPEVGALSSDDRSYTGSGGSECFVVEHLFKQAYDCEQKK